jgi:hypothetical protein
MKRVRELPNQTASTQSPSVARQLCDSIDAATRKTSGGNALEEAGQDIRAIVSRGLELFSAGTIDRRGMASINRAAAKADKEARGVVQRAGTLIRAQQLIDKQRRDDQLRRRLDDGDADK